ncbi:Leucine-rich repeat-containing protein 71, partial [Rhizoclosmatium hyalinum]
PAHSADNLVVAGSAPPQKSVAIAVKETTLTTAPRKSETKLTSASTQPTGSKPSAGNALTPTPLAATQSVSTFNLAPKQLPYAGNAKYYSRYKFQPTICVETAEGDEDEEIFKVEVRGWRISAKMMEILGNVFTGCSGITHLVLWNCGLTESHFVFVLGAILSSNVRHLNLDQNPEVPETLYAHLLVEDSLIKHLSLRSNKITCVGAKALAASLKTNRVIQTLDLWANLIGKDGASELAEALKFNQSLTSLSMARNCIGDEGAIYFAKMLSNYSLLHDELSARKKALVDMERIRREQEEDPLVKKAKAKIGNGLGRQAGKKSEENLNKKEAAVDPKNAKKGAAAPPGKAPPGGKAPPPGGKDKKTPEVAPPAPAGKKGAPAPAATPAADKGGKDKKGAAPAAPAKGKKGKVEEAKEEVEENNDAAAITEPTFEHNGQQFLIGNRTLNNLNLRQNGITETGVKAFLDAVAEQELSSESAPEGLYGLFRVSILENAFDKENATHAQLQTLLNAKNPWIEQVTTDKKEDEDGTTAVAEAE